MVAVPCEGGVEIASDPPSVGEKSCEPDALKASRSEPPAITGIGGGCTVTFTTAVLESPLLFVALAENVSVPM